MLCCRSSLCPLIIIKDRQSNTLCLGSASHEWHRILHGKCRCELETCSVKAFLPMLEVAVECWVRLCWCLVQGKRRPLKERLECWVRLCLKRP